MPLYLYPKSPFKHNSEIRAELQNEMLRLIGHVDDTVFNDVQARLDCLCSWLCSTPKTTTFRVNNLVADTETVVKEITKELSQIGPTFKVRTNRYFPELIVVSCCDTTMELNFQYLPKEIIVDSICGTAVLRGAHVFAPGVMGIPQGLQVGDTVSVYADLTGDCKKGFNKRYVSPYKVFLGNGVLRITRNALFGATVKSPSGIAVFMTDVVSRLPSLSDSVLSKGSALLQNLPSIICSRVLNPLSDEIILDMCAAPGNKTTHISDLMKGSGTIVALEKIKSKVERMRIQCNEFCATNIQIFCFDSTKAVSEVKEKIFSNGPPYNAESFDRILLDVPCSALGQRPQLTNPITVAQINSYVPLQRKLFSAAVQLLKFGGVLVYSTCTITVGENEGIVSWALRTYPYLRLESVRKNLCSLGLPHIGASGMEISGLTSEESKNLCRFGVESDSVGFFIACFVKTIAET
ncbi:tRNA (cytosine(72)-C(5))-methyltransferase NSUN6 isoform X1 [Neodiprion lecontei]|uniref:tRNA (Cytosine(72)-C(5))-methyltransferase NSUN6 isoform X1 n=1 Tax=Neodiprion lecontei TaxID=441921 RepID=A0A6J0BZ99_NEOLC|nr:tRNA (cytosine(72)-C(5))-methyltransferase NSUN6 isoform X1 [Neodiprion lecontei]